MKKYILKKAGKEVKKGDVLDITDVTVDDALLDYLANKGFVEVKEVEEGLLKPYIRKLARKMGFPFFGAVAFLQSLTEVSAFAAYQLLLLQISKDFNKDRDLKKFSELAVVGVDGRVVLVKNKHLNYAHIPVFITMVEAQRAIEIVYGLHELLYGEQENH